jgi:hypothetical protein
MTAIPPQSDLDRELLGPDSPQRLNLNRFWAVADFAPPRQTHTLRAVLRARYSPGGHIQAPYTIVGARFGVSAERARQLVARALRLMRHPARLKQVLAGNDVIAF